MTTETYSLSSTECGTLLLPRWAHHGDNLDARLAPAIAARTAASIGTWPDGTLNM